LILALRKRCWHQRRRCETGIPKKPELQALASGGKGQVSSDTGKTVSGHRGLGRWGKVKDKKVPSETRPLEDTKKTGEEEIDILGGLLLRERKGCLGEDKKEKRKGKWKECPGGRGKPPQKEIVPRDHNSSRNSFKGGGFLAKNEKGQDRGVLERSTILRKPSSSAKKSREKTPLQEEKKINKPCNHREERQKRKQRGTGNDFCGENRAGSYRGIFSLL